MKIIDENLLKEWELLFKDIQNNESSKYIQEEDILLEINDYRNNN